MANKKSITGRRLGPKTRIKMALIAANREIRANGESGGKYARAMAGEGYAGGYADALMDVQLLLNGCEPRTRNYWDIPPTEAV